MKSKQQQQQRRSRRMQNRVTTLALPRASPTFPFPSTFRTKLTYATAYSLDPATGSIAWVRLRANSLYDPDYAVGGHQPYGFDQLATIYGRYAVSSCRAKFSLIGNQSNLPIGAIVGSFNAPGYTSSLTTFSEAQENPRVKSRLVGLTGAANIVTLTQVWSAKDMFGIADSDLLASAVASAATNADPVLEPIIGFGIAAQISSDDPISQVVHCYVEYDALFGSPNTLVSS